MTTIELQRVLILSSCKQDKDAIEIQVQSIQDFNILVTSLLQIHNYQLAHVDTTNKKITFIGLNENSYIYLGAVDKNYVKWMEPLL